MTLLKKRPKERMGVRQEERKESARHRRFVRSHVCVVLNCIFLPIEFCHVRLGLPEGEQAGIGQKPHDAFGVPMCAHHHRIQHTIGEASFEKRHKVNLLATAIQLARLSPDPAIREKAQSVTDPQSTNHGRV